MYRSQNEQLMNPSILNSNLSKSKAYLKYSRTERKEALENEEVERSPFDNPEQQQQAHFQMLS